jgi:hypothetical protein
MILYLRVLLRLLRLVLRVVLRLDLRVARRVDLREGILLGLAFFTETGGDRDFLLREEPPPRV